MQLQCSEDGNETRPQIYYTALMGKVQSRKEWPRMVDLIYYLAHTVYISPFLQCTSHYATTSNIIMHCFFLIPKAELPLSGLN